MSLETYGRYQLLKKLATGGMAQIYLARQLGPEGFEKLLVVKRILPHLAENEEFITMFLDEARIAARLNHPNVVQIFDLGAQDDSFFIAMEFIHGEDVRRVWKHADKIGTPIPLALICRIIIEACAGLDYAHKKLDGSGRPLNIVHRDISPQNILVSFEGGVKIVDFGIAKAADQATVTKSGVLKGKYSYMSPEQAAGQPIDCRTDIFALGVVLYELLTGTRLFKRATDIQTLNAVTECKLALPSEVNDRIPPDLDEIVMKALAKDRTQRYSEARQLGAALESWLLLHGIPASTAAVAEFMHEIYADRLKHEQEEGRLLIETAEASKGEEAPSDKEKATPSLDRLPRQTKSMRATQSQAKPKRELEETTAERPGSRSGSSSKKAVDRALEDPAHPERSRGALRPIPEPRKDPITHTEASMPTQNNRSRRMPVIAIGLLVLAATVGVGLWSISAAPGLAKVSLDSTPSGATVKRHGTVVCTTPCELNELAPGEFAITVEKPGFVTVPRSVVLKAGVTEGLGTIVLEPEKTVVPPEVVKPPEVISPPPVASALMSIESDPSGAEVKLNGEAVGVTPFSRSMPVKTAVEVKLELAGHVAVTERFTVGEGAEDLHRFTLKPVKNTVKPVKNPPPIEVKPPVAGRGTLRFVVKPWAEVECREAGIKDTTPFQDKLVPVGNYSCTFTNPEFPPQTKLVRVEANTTVKVQVNFLQ
ncbi:MAG: serine/threonine-protein kinase [Archangium sp.]|nr:serine/threonine-protein kinase [Archangium sp.]